MKTIRDLSLFVCAALLPASLAMGCRNVGLYYDSDGYGGRVSYGYTGGVDLETINPIAEE